MPVVNVRGCTLRYTVAERNEHCGDGLACAFCGWHEDEAKRRKKNLRLRKCADGLWRKK